MIQPELLPMRTHILTAIAGDTLRLMVDNNAASADGARVEPEMYVGM